MRHKITVDSVTVEKVSGGMEIAVKIVIHMTSQSHIIAVVKMTRFGIDCNKNVEEVYPGIVR